MRTFFISEMQLFAWAPCCLSAKAMLPDGAMLLRGDVACGAMLLSQRCVPLARYVQNPLRH